MHGGLDNARQMIRVDRDDQAWTGKAASQFRAHAARLCLPAVDRSKAVVAEQRRHPRAGIWPLMLHVMGGRIADDPGYPQRLGPDARVAVEADDGPPLGMKGGKRKK